MKKFFILLSLLLITVLLPSALAIEVPSIMDTLVQHRVLLYEKGDTFEEYIVIFYASGNEVLKQLNNETHFYKSAGYTLDCLKSVDISQYYPGFYSMDFADSLIEDKGDYYSMVIRFKNLDYLANLDSMKKNGILPNDSYAFDANYIIEGLVASGMKELSMTEYGGLGLNYTVG